MVKRNRGLIAVTISLSIIALWAAGADAGSRKLKQLRAEIAELQAGIAELQGETRFLMRRELRPRPAMVPIGGVCSDPCASDADGDGMTDCEDLCPCDGNHADGDADGTPDCVDPCPTDAADGCIDPCPWDEVSGACGEPPPSGTGGCVVSGCSGQACAARPVITTCEFLPEYACYRKATCEPQADGVCGWTPTEELGACLKAARGAE